jgi:hypothetical protein
MTATDRPFHRQELYVSIILFLALFGYYLFFFDKGLVVGDEGYSLHVADRILRGEVPLPGLLSTVPSCLLLCSGRLVQTLWSLSACR